MSDKTSGRAAILKSVSALIPALETLPEGQARTSAVMLRAYLSEEEGMRVSTEQAAWLQVNNHKMWPGKVRGVLRHLVESGMLD